MNQFQETYDKRYLNGYRETLTGYEYARWNALDHLIRKVLKLQGIQSMLDYGSGSGLHVALWKQLFPLADLSFCDLSSVALEKLSQKYPECNNSCYPVTEGKAQTGNVQFDLIISVEVMEHVENLSAYLEDIKRLLKANAYFVWTTPCANRFSIEQIYGTLTGQIEQTYEGFSRWKYEDPSHLRRLKSSEIRSLLKELGFYNIGFRYRAHFFSFVFTRFCTNKLKKFGEKMMLLDYSLFRMVPNAASMIGFAQK